MSAEIITIGDELLIGQVIDTNSSWIARELNKIGVDVVYKTTVGDIESDILDAFEKATSRVDLILVTGGLGPTKDDITLTSLCKFFQTELVFDEKTLETIEEVVRLINKPLNSLTRDQAYVPKAATVIQNRMGTAPSTWFEKDGKILVSMPGVPYEMQWLVSNEIIPRLQNYFKLNDSIQHHTFWVKSYTESLLALALESFENELPPEIKLAYLPSSGLIRLRLTGRSDDKNALTELMISQRDKLCALLKNDIISEEDESLEWILDKKLKEKGLTLSLAESCTGGKLSSLFTAIPGCSVYYKGSVTSYSNEAKVNILSVSPDDIDIHGAVSRAVVEQMVTGAQRLFSSDCAIATSGIAGPDGGTPDKPVGTVWISARYGDQMKSELFHFSKNRENNIMRACNSALRMLLEMLAKN
ncbi:competence/damage-inducible protein A [Bacteroidales bacterium OttesenSCG-928-A17]|nr:competence/damage-inducible protein A [Bacteroidales bacterium OttesenSCG-928-A17]